jgi:hypothetical protein
MKVSQAIQGWTGAALIALTALVPFSVAAQSTFYVRQGAAGAENGSDWNNAYTSLPATLQRGAKYYVADGTYSAYTFDDSVSGTEVITIKKAGKTGEHTSVTGWQEAYGNGQASFGNVTFVTGYYVFDGQTRNESNWQDISSYGFRIKPGTSSGITIRALVTDITVAYLDVGNDPEVIGFPSVGNSVAVKMADGGGRDRLTFHRCHFHNVQQEVHALFCGNNVTIEYCHLGPSYGKESIGVQVGHNWIIRYNRFVLNCGTPNVEAGTAVIGVFDYFSPQNPDEVQADNWEIYGCVFAGTGRKGMSLSQALVYANTVDNWKFYNCTIHSTSGSWGGRLDINGNGNLVRNCLWHRLGDHTAYTGYGTMMDVAGTIEDFSWCFYDNPLPAYGGFDCRRLNGIVYSGSEDPFVNAAALDFRLRADFHGISPKDKGQDLGSRYNLDAVGNVRGRDGAWDIGAFEYVSDAPDTAPPVISEISVVSVFSDGAVVNWVTDEPATSVLEYGLTAAYGEMVSSVSLVHAHSVSLSGLVPDTVYHFRAKSADRSGNTTISSDRLLRTGVADITPPFVTVNAPSGGSVLSGLTLLTASTSDGQDGSGIMGIHFLVNEMMVGEGTAIDSTTYVYTWNTMSVANGNYLISAIAKDVAGNESSSTEVPVAVENLVSTLRVGLEGYWSCDDDKGSVLFDHSGFGRHGLLTQAVGYGDGKHRDALDFSASDGTDRVELGGFDISGEELSLAAWIKAESVGHDPRIIAKSAGPQLQDMYWLLEIDDGPPHRLGFRVHSAGSVARLTGGLVEVGQWMHAVGVYDGRLMRLYQNGVEVGRQAKDGALRLGASSVWIGNSPTDASRPFVGLIDEVRVYGRALSASEVEGLYSAQSPKPPTELGVGVK